MLYRGLRTENEKNAATHTTMSTVPEKSEEGEGRDRYQEATLDIAEHLGGKLWATLHATLRTPENQARLQSLLDPVVSHIIGRIFPYILLSAILFLILFLLSERHSWN